MKTSLAMLAFLALTTCVQADPAPPISVGTLLRQETDLSTLPRLRDWGAHLQSSYDRTGGNGDANNYVAVDGKTATLADVRGPGALVRLWSANPHGQLKIYIDDAPQPVVDVPFAKLFDGSTPPFAAPVAAPSSGGFYCYLPMPYAHHCRVTVDDPGGLYYHVGYVSYSQGTAVQPFALPLSADDQAALTQAQTAWAAPDWPVAGRGKTHRIRAGRTETLAQDKGAGVVRLVQTSVPDADDAALRRLVLRAYFDGHKAPDVVAPLSDFFGNAYGRGRDFSSLLERRQSGVWEARFPMPFGRSSRFTLENGNSQPVKVQWAEAVEKQPFRSGQDGYFHAQWRQEITRRGSPHVWTTVQGRRGHFVGIVQTMAGPGGLGFLEGDEQFRVDAETWLPSQVNTTVISPWNGTGTEDCFNSGWYFSSGPNGLPMNGALVREDAGRINAYRWFVNDAPVFQSSLDAQIEHGGANDAPGVYYSSVAFWYDDGAVAPGPVMPPAGQIALPQPLVPVPHFKIPGAIEGESLRDLAKTTGGQVQAQDMSAWPGLWSGDSQLWWTGAKVGDTLTVPVTPPDAGTYDVIGYFTRAADYGRFTFSVSGQKSTLTLDAYHDGVVPSGPLLLGRFSVPAGGSPLVITVDGKDMSATNYLFGLDALRLLPAR